MKLISRPRLPDKGFVPKALHYLFLVLLPIVVFIAVRLDFAWIGALLVLLGKWRIFSVKARHWPALFRANAVDTFFGLSMVVFMSQPAATLSTQLGLTGVYILWLVALRPRSGPIWSGIQALISQTLALLAIFLQWTDGSTLWLMFATWSVCYLCARHFLATFDEAMSRATAYAWAFFAAALVWVLSHWLIMYGGYFAQPAVLLSFLAYALATMYYLDRTRKLKTSLRWQLVGLIAIGVLMLIVFSDWNGNIT